MLVSIGIVVIIITIITVAMYAIPLPHMENVSHYLFEFDYGFILNYAT